MHLGIIKITYNRTIQPECYHNAFYGQFCNDNLALLNQQLQVCFVIILSICYWLFKCWVSYFTCVGVCVCVCSSVWARETLSHNRGLCTANTYEHHHCVCNSTLLPFWAWTDGKTKDIIIYYVTLFSTSLLLVFFLLSTEQMLALYFTLI